MTHEEAINIIKQATAQLSATLEVHTTIQQAIQFLDSEQEQPPEQPVDKA